MLFNKFLFFILLFVNSFANNLNISGKVVMSSKLQDNLFVLNNKGILYNYHLKDDKINRVVDVKDLTVQFFEVDDNYCYFFSLDRIIRFDMKKKFFSKIQLPYDIASNSLKDKNNMYVLSGGCQLNRIKLNGFKKDRAALPLYPLSPRLLYDIYFYNNHIVLLTDISVVIYDKNLKVVKKHNLYDSNTAISNKVRYIGLNEKKQFVVAKNDVMYIIDKDLKMKQLKDKEISLSVLYSQDVKFKIEEKYLLIDDKKVCKLIGYNYNMKKIGKYILIYNSKGGMLYLGNKVKLYLSARDVNAICEVEGDNNMLLVDKKIVTFK